MKLTYEVSDTAGVVANLYSGDRRLRAGILRLNREYAEIAREIAFQLSPKDTTYMATHIRRRLTAQGYGFAIGWNAADFVGVVNPVSGRIMGFYPPEVELGSFNSPPQPTLRPTMNAIRDEYRARVTSLVRAAYLRSRR